MQVNPLREQSKKAKEYLENKEGLDKYEVALLAHDIENLSNELEKNKKKKEMLDKEIITISNEASTNDAKNIEDNNKLEKLEVKLVNVNKELLEVTEEVERINGEKKLLKERTSNSKDKEEIANKLRNLLEDKGNINKNIELLTLEVKNLMDDISKNNNEIAEYKNSIDKFTKEKSMEQNEYSRLDRSIINTKHRIDSLSVEIDNGGNIPNSVKSILRSNSLSGIHNTIGNIVNVDDKYVKALEVAISSSKNFIITDDEISSKEAINYLKDNHLGRATFFPLNVIKYRYIDSDTLNKIGPNSDFIAVLADIVDYDDKYKNIIYNQLGTVLVSNDIDSATRLSKIISHRYKIVTLDGDVIHVGGSMSGGSSYQSKSIISLKQELKSLEIMQRDDKENIEITKNKIIDINKELETLNEEYMKLSRSTVLAQEVLNSKNDEINILHKSLDSVEREIANFKGIQSDSISAMEEELINKYNLKNTLKEKLNLDSKNLTKTIEELKDKLEKRQATDKLKNSNLRNLEKEIKELEINITRADVKLDSMLNTLNEEYSLTYERAKNEYELDLEVEEARSKVNTYKANIKRIGMVNLSAIEEFERVNTRFEFLTKQKEDLLGAESTLLEIMNEMDDVMVEEFSNTFEKIREEFKNVFK